MDAPPPYQPGPLGPPQQPPRSRSTRTVLVVVGVVLVLCCGGLVTGGLVLWRTLDAATRAPRQTADAFVTDLQSGRTREAYDLLCRPARDAYPVDRFTEVVDGRPRITAHRVVGVSVQTVNGAAGATVTMDLTQAGGGQRYSFLLVEEGGQWRVCGSPY